MGVKKEIDTTIGNKEEEEEEKEEEEEEEKEVEKEEKEECNVMLCAYLALNSTTGRL